MTLTSVSVGFYHQDHYALIIIVLLLLILTLIILNKKKMRKVILSLVLLISISISGKSQENDTIPDLLPYEDATSRLFISKVVEVKDKSQKEI